MSNTRVFYPAHQVGIKGQGNYVFANSDVIHGLQSVAMTTNFSLEPLFELGQINIYENREDVPDVEVTLSKVLDGYEPMYCKATQDAVGPNLAGRSVTRATVAMSIFRDTEDRATGIPLTAVACSGMFVSSVSYNFSTEGAFTEELTLVGNNKIWAVGPAASGQSGISTDNRPDNGQADLRSGLGSITFLGAFTSLDAPLAVGGVAYREDMIFDTTGTTLDVNGCVADPNATILPLEVQGISSSGTNNKSNGEQYDAHITSISCSVDLSREDVNELGRRGPYTRTPNYPVQTTCEIQVLTTQGDLVSALEDGNFGSGAGCAANFRNLNDNTIRIATCEGLRVYLGARNKLSSVNYSGGDANGGNVTVSYSYQGYNDFTVMHDQDSNSNFTTNLASKQTYLRDLT